MADIRLAKPAAGTTQTVPSAPDGRFIFDFPADAATLTRNGDDLVLTFEDGAAIQLQGFYTTYSKEEMPSFQVDGVEISGQDFFAALDEDLMPAAGPASGSSAARGGRYNEYGGSDLLDGLDHLGRLDIGFDGGTQLATDTVEPSPYSEVDHGVTVTPSTPGTDPDDPSIPVQGEDFPPTMPHDVLQVDESALDGGSGGGSATAAGSMRVSAPDGVAIITIGGVVVWQNGALTGNPVLTDEGHLDVTGFDGTNLTYTYTLTGSTQEHAKLNAGGENDAIAHEMAVVVTDRDGDSGSAVIRVEITDDVPTIKSFERDVTEGATAPVEGNALEGSAAGADGADFAWTNPTQQGQYGTITLNPNGSYSYTLDNNNAEVKALTDGQRLTEEFTYTYTDADGDVAEGKVTITINGVNNGVEVGSGTLTVYEAGLDDGSQAGQDAAPTTAEGSLTVNAPDGVKDIRIDGVTVFENGALTGNTVSTDEGTLTVTGFDEATGELKFTYELTGNTLEHNTDATDKQLSHDLAVTVTDVDGSTDIGVVTVVITDDGPVVTPVETEYKGNKYVNTVSVSFGADNDTGTDSSLAVNAHDVDGTVIEWIKVDDSTSSGTDLSKLSQGESWTNGNIIVSRENGNFVFKIKENGSNAHITVTATDADGDTDTEELNLTAPDAGPNAIIVDEALLTDGNVVNSDNSGHKPSGTGSFTVNLNGEDGTVTLNYGTGENSSITLSLINGETFDKDWLSTNKTLTVNGVVVEVTGATQQDGSWKIEYSYSLTGQQTHTGQGVGENDALSDEIDITVTDATGDTSTGLLTVTVHDDGPVLSDVVAEASQIVDTQSTISLDFSGLSVGADSEGATLTVEVNGTTFTGTQDGAGKWNFTSTDAKVGEAFAMGTGGQFIYTRPEEDTAGEANNSYTFNVTVTDADGDAVSDSVTVTTAVKPGFEGQPSEGSVVDNLVTDDSGLDGGNVSDPDGPGEADSAQDTGSFRVTLNGREYTITLTGKEDSVTLELDADGNLKDSVSLDGVELEGNYGTLSNISVSGGTISYTYTQTDNYLHDADGNNRDAAATGADSFGVTVSDGLNGDVSGTISVTIEDDGPVISTNTTSGSSLTVDESYADNVAGPGLELEGSANTDTVSLDVSNLFSVDAGADGEAGREFALSISNKGQTGQKVLVGGSQYDLILRENNDGSISGVAGDENGTVIFNITISNDGNVTLDMTGYGSLVHPHEGSTAQEHDEALSITGVEVTLTVTDTDGDSDSASADLVLIFEDDAPVVTVNGDVPASLELTESTETALQTFNASTLFDIKFGADTEASSTKYELTYREDANSGLKAIVDGKEYDVTLQLEGGILKGTAGGTNIFTVSVAEDTGEVTLAMTGHGTLRHDKTAADDELHLKGVGVKVTVTDGDDDSTTSDSADLTLTITDDVPTISESQKAAIIPSSEEDEDIADFDFNNATKANNAEWVPGWVEGQLPESGNGQVYDHNHEYWGNIEDGYKELALNQGNHTITFSAAVVQYQGSDGNPIEHGDQDDDAPSIKITDITDNITSNEAPLLTFVSTAWNQGESGMAVYSGQRGPWGDQSDGEIGAINGKFNEGNTEWEAVKMDLGEDEAYSITIRLNSFYNTPGDQEKAYIILMNDDKVVDKLLIEGKDAEDGIVDSTKLSSAEAFNTVYIVPWGTKSDFLLNGVEVGYSPVTVLKSEGRVEAGSADGIKGYSFGYDQNDVVTVNEKNLTVSVEDDGKTIHFLSSSSDDDTYTKVIVGEATITEVGKWTLNWFDQETNPQQDTDFTLPIIATDGDDDTAEIKVVPSEDEVGDSQAADALPEEEEKQPAAEKREGKDGPQGMMDGALLQSSMAAEAAAPRMAAATLLGMALVADAADDVLAAATGTDGMPHADVKADGLSGDIGDAPSTLHMDGAAQSGADAFDATLDSSLFAPGVMDPLADGTESLEGLLPDKEHAPFDAEGLLFTAAAPDLSDDASGLVGKGVASGDVLPPAGEEGILGTEETDVLHGTDADDILRGGDGDELIFGGSGDDYIDGGEGRDTIYAGDGNDIIVYDKADYLVSGGSGIDFMVSDDSGLTLDTLLSGGKDGHEGPIVDSIEVLLKGNDALSLTSIQELADKYGITLGTNPDGQETLTLDMGKWTEQADGSYDFHGGAEEGGLTLETNLQHDSDASSDNGEMAQQVFILEHTNS